MDVALVEDGDVRAVVTADHGSLEADLFVDCTGFRRSVIGRLSPSLRFESYSRSLFCDRAVVLRSPYHEDIRKERDMHPYVRASAAAAGWIWSIPLYSRMSRGYVYASQFLGDNEAEQELRTLCGNTRAVDGPCHRIRFESGRLEAHWVRNCVAVGLSEGFIEPLESTGLAITQLGIEILASMLDARFYDEAMRRRYNGHLEKFYENIFHFIVAHYCLTRRSDTPFWRSVRDDTEIPDALAARLEVFRRHLPSVATKGTSEVWAFRDLSWFCVLAGMGFEFADQSPTPVALAAAEVLKEQRRAELQKLTASATSHYRYLRERIYVGVAPFAVEIQRRLGSRLRNHLRRIPEPKLSIARVERRHQPPRTRIHRSFLLTASGSGFWSAVTSRRCFSAAGRHSSSVKRRRCPRRAPVLRGVRMGRSSSPTALPVSCKCRLTVAHPSR